MPRGLSFVQPIFSRLLALHVLLGPIATLAAASIETARPYQLFSNMQRTGQELATAQTLTFFTASVGSFAIARQHDDRVRAAFVRQDRFGASIDQLTNDFFGTGVPGALLGGAFWLIGDQQDNASLMHAGQAQVEAIALTGITVAAGKYLSQRERPDNSDRYSFPSGHTSTVFASAIVLQEFYGWKAGLPMFMLGAATGLGRVNADRHWFSDTVGGAGVGLLVGRAVASAHRGPAPQNSGRTQAFWLPLILSDGAALMVRVTM